MFLVIFIAIWVAVLSAADSHLKVDFDLVQAEPENAKRLVQPEIPVASAKFYYQASLRIGSAGALNKVLLDTGSSDLWVMSAGASCLASKNSPGGTSCLANGAFNPSMSSSFQRMSNYPALNANYQDGRSATGYFGSDSITFGSVSVPKCIFGVAQRTTSTYGIFGIGLPALEATNANTLQYNGTGLIYPNFPQVLKNNGVTNKNVYSLYLNSLTATSGSILFGAVDHAKYSGTLQTVPLVNPYPQRFAKPTRVQIMLTSVYFQGSLYLSTYAVPALLDSGYTRSTLPVPVVSRLAQIMLGVMTVSGVYQVNCSYLRNTRPVVFNFSGVRIAVPLGELVYKLDSLCYLGISGLTMDAESGKPGAVLGDNVLRRAYVVYDLEAYEISLAQAQYGMGVNIEAVTSTVPLAVRAPGYTATSYATYSATGYAQNDTTQMDTEQTSFLQATSNPSTSTRLSGGTRRTYLTETMIYSAICAFFLAYL